MRILFLYIVLACNSVLAQTPLTFNKTYIESEDHWVAYPSNDSSYYFGFVYIDPQAGPTLDYGGSFKINSDGKLQAMQAQGIEHRMKVRLQPSNRLVAIIPEDRLSELMLPSRPDWLQGYKQDTTSAQHFYNWGYIYNVWNQPLLAISFLEKALQINPEAKGLKSEMAYTYNALGKYEDAFNVVKDLKEKSCYDYKELTYSLIRLDRINEAEKMCGEAMSACNDPQMKAEIAFNLAGHYCKIKDKANYEIWSAETRKWAKPGDKYSQALEKLDAHIQQ
jgi:tetratricopeptide (TPR) repeat protein